MINTIKYYYNINASDIKQINEDYFFDKYILKMCYKELDIQLYNFLVNNNYYLHQIIYNRNNEYITYIDNKPYLLLKMLKEDVINFDLLKKYNISFKNKNIPNWDILWANKIDHLEKNISNVKDILIRNTSNYFIGMTENAIILFKSLNLENDYYICHLRLDDDYSFYDPLNIVIDYKMRDYAEYLKREFYLYNKYYYSQIDKIIMNNNYNNTMLFFIRMLYPSSFFDAYDNYMKKDKIDYSFYNKINDYEKYLKYIYKKIKTKYNIIDIEWLK